MLQALAIYKSLSIEQPVLSAESDVETHHVELDSGHKSIDDVVHSNEKVKTEETSTNSVDNV